jgi:hypothetical protein
LDFLDGSFSCDRKKRGATVVRVGFGCFAIALVAMAVIFGIMKLMPSREKSMHTIEIKAGKD